MPLREGGALQLAANLAPIITPPDYETPLDADEDNVYEVEVEADDGNLLTTVQTIRVTVVNQGSISGAVFVDVNPALPTD